jgi:hypothetical protein
MWVLLFFASLSWAALPSPLELRTEGKITCDICLAFAELADLALSLQWTEDKILEEAAFLCPKLLPYFSEEMCSGLIQERFGPIVWAILKRANKPAKDFCDYLKLCNLTAVTDGPTPIYQEQKRKQPTAAGGKKLFLQISDVHFDQYYQVV